MFFIFPDCKDEWAEVCITLSTDHDTQPVLTQAVLFSFPLPLPCSTVTRRQEFGSSWGVLRNMGCDNIFHGGASSLRPWAGSLLLALPGVFRCSSLPAPLHPEGSLHGLLPWAAWPLLWVVSSRCYSQQEPEGWKGGEWSLHGLIQFLAFLWQSWLGPAVS